MGPKFPIKNIFRQLVESKIDFDLVVGVARGGLVPAVAISHFLDVPLGVVFYSAREDNKSQKSLVIHGTLGKLTKHTNILVVDDIADTGKTLEDIRDCWGKYLNLRFATLHWKLSSKIKPDFYGAEIANDAPWITYPWESIVSDEKKQQVKSQ